MTYLIILVNLCAASAALMASHAVFMGSGIGGIWPYLGPAACLMLLTMPPLNRASAKSMAVERARNVYTALYVVTVWFVVDFTLLVCELI